MSDEALGSLCAALFCLGSWGAMAAGSSALAHWRMRRVEAALGHRALPPDERALAFYAGASVVWLSALVLALVGLFKRDWARVGRNCWLIFVGHMSLVTLAAMVAAFGDAHGSRAALPPMVGAACAIAAASFVAACVFFWRWAGARAERIAAQPAEGEPEDPPGAERFAVYVLSFLFAPVGLVAAFIYRKPSNVRVGMHALRLMGLQIALIAVTTCATIPVVVYLVER